jgi:membrane-anchored protein YejM (alkaline phosphatase superfamily)
MAEAPLVSTFVAVALIPVAFLFTHAFLSGRLHLPYHKLTGTLGVIWDLGMSIFYMLYRLFGGNVESHILDVSPNLVAYFAVHGVVAVIVIALELLVLTTGLLQWRKKKAIPLHRKLSIPLYILWFGAFLSGELVYIVYYILS